MIKGRFFLFGGSVLSVLFIGVGFTLLFKPNVLEPDAVKEAPSSAPALAQLQPLPPLAQLRQTTDRSLFSPIRRPKPKAPPPPPRPQAPPPLPRLDGWTLTGVAMGPGHAMAIFQHTDKTRFILSEGETLNGWTVNKVRKESAELEHGTTRQVFQVWTR